MKQIRNKKIMKNSMKVKLTVKTLCVQHNVQKPEIQKN